MPMRQPDIMNGAFRVWACGFGPRSRASAPPSFGSPFCGASVAGGYRRVNIPGFPYYVAYGIRGELILVTAVGHSSRRPDYWKRPES